MTTTQDPQSRLRRDEITTGVILNPPGTDLRCRIENVEGSDVLMKVLDNKTHNGQSEFHMKINDLITNNWQLTRKAA